MTIDHIHRYGHFVSHIAGDTEVAIGDILGEPTDPVVAIWIGHVELRGRRSAVRQRLTVAIDLLERAQSHPELWELLQPRRARAGQPVRRHWRHPFRDPPGLVPSRGSVSLARRRGGDDAR